MNVQIVEDAHDCIALVRPDDGPLTVWARHDPGDWAYLGAVADDSRSLSTAVAPSDIVPLALQMEALDDAFEVYVAGISVDLSVEN